MTSGSETGKIALKVAEAIAGVIPAGKNFGVMEVCGTHTVSIARHGLRKMLPPSIRLVSGPGCPVCVTPSGEIDRILEIAVRPGVVIATFGDMLKVRGSKSCLEESGVPVQVIYSPLDAVKLAAQFPQKKVVFIGAGFETTAPAVAVSVLEAEKAGLANYFVFPVLKTVPQALAAILSSQGNRVDGFLLPGHVSAVIGLEPYKFIADKYKVPAVVAGFEALDILSALEMLVRMLAQGRCGIENAYARSVRPEGNPAAVAAIYKVFRPCDAPWRGIGVIKASGLEFKSDYKRFDAAEKFAVGPVDVPEPEGCRCAEVLTGKCSPVECGLFGKKCTPIRPVGPCMVSSEGACAAWYNYG